MRRELSVVIPAYNEAEKLAGTLAEILDYLVARNYEFEVIVVDDGSTDATAPIAFSFQKRHPEVCVIHRPRNSGKGQAVKEGIAKARYAYCLFMDADDATSIREWDRFEKVLEGGSSVVIGSRHLPGSRILHPQPWIRRFFGTGYRILCRRLLGLDSSDINCGFKAYETPLAKKVYARVQARDWTFDAEVLCLLKKFQVKVMEVPVHWKHHDKKSRSVVLKTVWECFKSLLELRDRYSGNSVRSLLPGEDISREEQVRDEEVRGLKK